MTRVWLLPAAVEDLEKARAWYEGQRAGLGDEFVDAIDRAVRQIRAFPSAHPVVHRDIRRYLVARFPYCAFYRTQDDDVVVLAFLHAARDPERRGSRFRH